MFPNKIDCFSSSGVSNSSGANSDQFVRKYLLTKRVKEQKIIPIKLLTMLIASIIKKSSYFLLISHSILLRKE